MVVTGASGFLGSNYLIELSQAWRGHESYQVVTPCSFRHRGIPERLTHLNWHDWLKVITVDLAAPLSDLTDRVMSAGNPLRVVNFASESHIPRSISDPAQFVKNNVELMVNLLEWARARLTSASGSPLFVHISTDEIYGEATTPQGHPEWSPIRPTSPYSASKAAQEAMVIAWQAAFGLQTVIVNTMNPLGLMQDPEKYLPTLISKISNGMEVQIHVGPDGKPGSRAYLDARDLHAAIELVSNPWTFVRGSHKPLRVNVAGDRECDNLEFAQIVAKALGRPLKYQLVESSSPSHSQRHALDTAKIRGLGWAPRYSLEDSVARVVEWTLTNPAWFNRQPRPPRWVQQ